MILKVLNPERLDELGIKMRHVLGEPCIELSSLDQLEYLISLARIEITNIDALRVTTPALQLKYKNLAAMGVVGDLLVE